MKHRRFGRLSGPRSSKNALNPLLSLSRFNKRLLAVVLDLGTISMTVWLAFYLRLGEFVYISGPRVWTVAAAVFLAVPLLIIFGMYRAVFRHAGITVIESLGRAIAIYAVGYATVFTFIGVPGVPRTVGLIQPILLLVALGASRLIVHIWLGQPYRRKIAKSANAVIIYGAGSAGRQLASAISTSGEMKVVAFVDDDPQLQGSTIEGRKIFPPSALANLTREHLVENVLLAVPSVARRRRLEILELIRSAGVDARILPSLIEIAQGRASITDLRPVQIEDLLGRDAVAPHPELLDLTIVGRTVFVTGAGGSIGSELCRQILQRHPRRIILIEASEFALYSIEKELKTWSARARDGVEILAILADVKDVRAMRALFASFRPETIYHAAAYKHVPIVEYNVSSGVRNNVLGTLVMARLARAYKVADFVLISTDKAVRPTNVMGASKRVAELMLQALAFKSSRTCFSMVRFGNVLGSSGSVVPLFRDQIAHGGPLTLTHPDITRYFMTVPEAAQLVLQAGALATGGEVFVLDMGDPVRISDLARNMVEMSGLTIKDAENPDGEIEVEYIGLRPGEKLYEELLIGNDPQATSHPLIMKANEHALDWAELRTLLNSLMLTLDGERDGIINALKCLVPDYAPESAKSSTSLLEF